MKNPFRRPPRDRGAPSLRPTSPPSAEKPMPEYRPVKKPAGKTAASSSNAAAPTPPTITLYVTNAAPATMYSATAAPATASAATEATAAGLLLDERFRQLTAEWQSETSDLSSPQAIAGHPAYLAIIALGRPALPLIFRELKNNSGGWWYPALRALTGANPVPESARGDRALNDAAWLRWAQENGYA